MRCDRLRYHFGPYPQLSVPFCSRRGPDVFFEGSEHRPGEGKYIKLPGAVPLIFGSEGVSAHFGSGSESNTQKTASFSLEFLKKGAS